MLPGRDKPWEIAIGWVSDYRDPVTGRYQLWYQAFTGRQAEKRTHRCLVCYAESSDGIHWTKPDLDLFDYNGIAPTNIVMLSNGGYSDRYANSVLVDPRDPDPARRYKMATYDFTVDEDGVERPGLVVAFSPDGIHWTQHPHAPLIRTSYAGHLPTPYEDEPERPWHIPLTISDAMDAIYDPPRDRFVIYSKMWLDGPDGRMHWKHAMGRTESQDFIHWTKPELVLAPDEHDPPWVEFHHSPAFFYNRRGHPAPAAISRCSRSSTGRSAGGSWTSSWRSAETASTGRGRSAERTQPVLPPTRAGAGVRQRKHPVQRRADLPGG